MSMSKLSEGTLTCTMSSIFSDTCFPTDAHIIPSTRAFESPHQVSARSSPPSLLLLRGG